MRTAKRAVGLLVSLLVIPLGVCSVAQAAGGSRIDPVESVEQPKSPIEQAHEHYNRGLQLRNAAWKYEKKAAKAQTPEKAQKLENKAHRSYERAIEEFVTAVNKNPSFHEAFSSLGYALRKTGQYDQALAAYDRALDLDPNYSEAIEYRGEAFLGLNRTQDAKDAYIVLFGKDRERADELLDAMKVWVEERRAEPQGLDAETLGEFEQWIAEREEIASSGTVSQHRAREW